MSATKINITDSINKFNGIISDLDTCTATIEKSINDLASTKLVGGGDDVEKIYRKMKKYKQMANEAKSNVQYFKSLAEYYYNSQVMTTQYYQGVMSKMSDMKDKMVGMNNQMSNITNQYSNNTEKIQMLETFVEAIEKLAKKPMEVDFSIKANSDGSKTIVNGIPFGSSGTVTIPVHPVSDHARSPIDTYAKGGARQYKYVGLGRKIQDNSASFLKGGNKSYEDLDEVITKSQEKILNSFRNIDFMNKKIKDLNERLTQTVKKNEDFFKIRTEIEWMVNRLEECMGENCDKKSVEKNFEKLWSIIKGIQEKATKTEEVDVDMVTYIQGLEKYVGMLESQVKSSARTIGSLHTDKAKELGSFVEKQLPESEVIETEKKSDQTVSKQVDETINETVSKPVSEIIDETAVSKPVGETNSETPTPITGGYKSKSKQKGGNPINVSLFDEFSSGSAVSSMEKIYSSHVTNDVKNFDEKTSELKKCALKINLPNATPKETGEATLIYSMIKNLDKLVIQVNKIIDDTQADQIFDLKKEDLISESDDSKIDFFRLWDDTFKNKKTDHYKKVLDKRVYSGTGDDSTKIAKSVIPKNISIKIEIKEDGISMTEIVDLLENTFVYLACLNYVLMKYVISVTMINESATEKGVGKDTADANADITSYDLPKSNFASFATFDNSYEEIIKPNEIIKPDNESTDNTKQVSTGDDEMIGGGLLPFLFKPETLSILSKVKADYTKLEHYLFSKYMDALAKNSKLAPKDALRETTKTIMENLKECESTVADLYDMISTKLGKVGDNFTTFISNVNRQQLDVKSKKDKTLLDLNQNFEQLFKTLSPSDAQVAGGKNSKNLKIIKLKNMQIGSGDGRPRLDPYKDQLNGCLAEIKKFAVYFPVLLELLNKFSSATLSMDESKYLARIYKFIQKAINGGRNSYIKVIPMIFFAVEFPPERYLSVGNNSADYYKFSFNIEKQKIKYAHILNGSEESDKDNEYSGAHAVFFDDNKKNATSYLLTDQLISLEKILLAESDPNGPENKVINMMFALGASGTGKTSRYFGLSGDTVNPLDKEGIVSFIIKNAKKTGASEVSVAYFVCYGQINSSSDGVNLIDTDTLNEPKYGEYVIFFSKPEADKEKDLVRDENEKYMPYFMPTQDAGKINAENEYTDFYKKIVTKSLSKINYTDLKDVLVGKVDTISTEGVPVGPFRSLIESSNEEIQKMWLYKKELLADNSVDSKEITDLFENLLGEQKKIATVMPTKNNIESSRGHTCVLIRFKYGDDSAGNPRYGYFPLFDMAGTEDPKGIKSFLDKFQFVGEHWGDLNGKEQIVDKVKMAKVMKHINLMNGTVTDKDTVNGKEEEFTMQSLNDMLNKSKLARDYLLKPIDQTGGGKIYIENIQRNATDDTNMQSVDAINFLNKVIKEGYYINHTIAMLIFVSLCVGSSVNTTKVGDVDNFDKFGSELFSKLQENAICLLGDKGQQPSKNKACNNTRYLLSEYTFSDILSKTSIWAQVLFSFLYWNKESTNSQRKILEGIKESSNTFIPMPYVKEMKQQQMKYL